MSDKHIGHIEDEQEIELNMADFEDVDLNIGVASPIENPDTGEDDIEWVPESQVNQTSQDDWQEPQQNWQDPQQNWQEPQQNWQEPQYDDNVEWVPENTDVLNTSPDKPFSKKEQKAAAKAAKKAKKNVEQDASQAQDSTKPTDLVLYIIIDKKIPGLIEYMRSFGLKVNAVFDNVSEARGYLLMQTDPTRVVIVDTGSGKFMTTMIRADLVDMMGVNSEDVLFTVFYSDPSLKHDAIASLGKEAKAIEWIKYSGSSVVVAAMLSHSENYIYDEATKMLESKVDKSILWFKGDETPLAVDSDNIGAPIITPEQVYKNLVDSNQPGIPGFEPVF